jgi:hypothetical protein
MVTSPLVEVEEGEAAGEAAAVVVEEEEVVEEVGVEGEVAPQHQEHKPEPLHPSDTQPRRYELRVCCQQ